MPRFVVNRWWAFILALTLACSAAAVTPRLAVADDSTGYVEGGTDGGGGMIGDPDVPTTPTKTRVVRGTLSQSTWYGAISAGDETVSTSAWMNRLIVLWQSLGMRWFGI